MMREGCLVIAVLALLLSACGSAPPPPPEEVEQAAQWNLRGRKAFQAGDHDAAQGFYERALSMQRALENLDGVAIELINISSVHRARGDIARAQQVLDSILGEDALPFGDNARAEAAARRALMLLEAGSADKVIEWLDRAEAWCRAEVCRARGVVLNLRARLALSRNEPVRADEFARKAAVENRRVGERGEEANSWRWVAEAAAARNDCAGAMEPYRQALALDKDTAASARIVSDLVGLARCSRQTGDTSMARAYFRRARSVAEGLADEKAVKAITEELRNLR